MSGAGPILSIEGVTHAYRETEVVRGVSLAVERGELFGVLGPNGSGKSTLVRLLSRVFPPRAGRICLEGRDLREWTPRDFARRVAVVPQETALDFPFCVLEVVLMGRAPHLGGLAFEGDRDLEVAEAAMAQAGVSHLAERDFQELSGGEKQRVVIARALAQEPALLLLDEPTTFLDIRHEVTIFDLLAALVAERGLTVVAVLHDLNLAALYCRRLAFLKEGRVLASGPTPEVLTYANIHAAYETEVYVGLNDLTGKLNVLPLSRALREDVARRFGGGGGR